MPGNRWRQPELGTKEIDRPGLAVVLAENGGAFLIFGTEVIINMSNGPSHFLPAELIGEDLWQWRRMQRFSARQLQPNRSHIRDELAGGQKRYHQWGESRA